MDAAVNEIAAKRDMEKEQAMKRMQEEINYLQAERRRLLGVLDSIHILARSAPLIVTEQT